MLVSHYNRSLCINSGSSGLSLVVSTVAAIRCHAKRWLVVSVCAPVDACNDDDDDDDIDDDDCVV